MRYIAAFLLCSISVAWSGEAGRQWAESKGLSQSQIEWLRSQKVPDTNFLCCNEADGEQVDEDIREGDYWINSEKYTQGAWMLVPRASIITQPNLFGRPVAWWQPAKDQNNVIIKGQFKIYCYSPGPLL